MEIREKNFLSRCLEKAGVKPLALIWLLFLVVLPSIPPFNQEYIIRWLVAAGLAAAMAIAFDFTSGYINIVNFGFYAFVGFGGYVSALLCENLGYSPWVGMLAGAAATGVLGLFLGLMTLRQRGIFAAVITWFVGLALMGLATNMVSLTRGALGLNVRPLFDSDSNLPYYYLILALMSLIYLVTSITVRSNLGLAFKAIGQNMDAARTSGINPFLYRVTNFVISCAIAGLLGGFYAHFYGIMTPDVMSSAKTVEVLVIVYIGGRASLWGGAVFAFPFILAMELVKSSLSDMPGVNLILYGVFLILTMLYYPNGLAGFCQSFSRKKPQPESAGVIAQAQPEIQ